jgi:chromate transport protein ChrA
MFLAHLLRGPLGAGLSLPFYVLPGVLIALALSVIVYTASLPVWATGAIQGISASSLGLFCLICLRNMPETRKVRLGPLVAIAAFVSQGLLQMDLLVVMACLGAVSILCNRPRRPQKEQP